MKYKFKAPRGTQDILPNKSEVLQKIERKIFEIAKYFGFLELRVPTFEHTELFTRSVGDSTDVVQKEMFTFEDRGGRSLSLRPEGTAGVVRAVVESGLINEALPLKVCYLLSCFRNERPQAGRLKEFHQFGFELFGASSPVADAELISLLNHLFEELGILNLKLELNSIGCSNCRGEYINALVDYYSKYKNDLCETCLKRLEKNPMRIIDCKNTNCKEISKNAPKILDYLCNECLDHFESVKGFLTDQGVKFEINPYIVRGLDYYTRTVFEFNSTDLGSQSNVCGGGRYDGLTQIIGGKSVPALGCGIGIERLFLIMEAQKNSMINFEKQCDIYIGNIGNSSVGLCNLLALKLRKSGLCVQTDLVGRSVKAQLKYADKIGAKYACIIGDLEIEQGKVLVKNMKDGDNFEVLIENFVDKVIQQLEL